MKTHKQNVTQRLQILPRTCIPQKKSKRPMFEVLKAGSFGISKMFFLTKTALSKRELMIFHDYTPIEITSLN